jgi:hypothetical protein
MNQDWQSVTTGAFFRECAFIIGLVGHWPTILKTIFMPWYNGDYPPSYKNQPVVIRNKATEIANELLLHGASEGVAIATGLKKAREIVGKAAKGPKKGKRG